tara:strand:- start:773 stop:1408 length:636 start_codon:yes stop_codon:yes gene_type:complete
MNDISFLYKRLIELCLKHKLHHVSSYFSVMPVLYEVFSQKKENDIFVLSNGHSSTALYVVLEELYGIDAERMIKEHGMHPKMNHQDKIFCSTGSLGMGITVATGAAFADKARDVYVVISDGECAEGSVWEALRFKNDNKLNNLKVYVNANGYTAYDSIDVNTLEKRLKSFCKDVNFCDTRSSFDFLDCVDGHYKQINDSNLQEFINFFVGE